MRIMRHMGLILFYGVAPDDLWAFMLTLEALGPQAELPPDLLACLQHAPQCKTKSRIVNE